MRPNFPIVYFEMQKAGSTPFNSRSVSKDLKFWALAPSVPLTKGDTPLTEEGVQTKGLHWTTPLQGYLTRDSPDWKQPPEWANSVPQDTAAPPCYNIL